MSFKRHISITGVFFATISASVGSGWLFSPYYAAKIAGPYAILAWLIGALLILPILLSFLMMATRFPVTGSSVRYTRCTHGKLLSFLCGWLTWLAAVMVPAIETIASLDYSSYFFPSLAHTVNGDTTLTPLGLVWACVIMLFFLFANLIGIRLVTRINSVVGVGKLLIPFIFIAVGLYYMHPGNFQMHGLSHDPKILFQAVATGGILFSIIGFRTVFEMSGEIHNPTRTLFVGALSGFATCILIYVLLEVAFIGILSPQDMIHGWQHLTFIGDQASPLMSIVGTMGLIWLLGILYLDAVISPASTGLINSTAASRVLYSISASGLLPKRLLALNKSGVPWVAIVLNFIIGMLFFLPFPGWAAITSFFASLMVLNYALGVVAMPALCRIKSGHIRGYQHVIAILGLYCALLLIHMVGWSDIWKLSLGTFIAMLVFIAYSKVAKTAETNTLKNVIWLTLLLLFTAVISYVGELGGGHGLISLKESCVSLAIVSLVTYWFGLRAALPTASGQALMQKAMEEAD